MPMKIKVRHYIPTFVEVREKPSEMEFNSSEEFHKFLKEKHTDLSFTSHGKEIYGVGEHKVLLYIMVKGDVGELREELEHDTN